MVSFKRSGAGEDELSEEQLIDCVGAAMEAKDNIGIGVKINRGFVFPRLSGGI